MNYDKDQVLAINSEDDKVLLMAAAGSGKTTTIVGAIRKFATENFGAKIIAITFTKKAAAELGLKTGLIGDVQSSTIHSWALKELNKLGKKHKFIVSLLQENKIKEILYTLSRSLGYYSLNQVSLFYYVTGNYNIDVADYIKNKFEAVNRAYIKFKRNNRLYDFMDLPLYLYDVLQEYDEYLETDALFVDEFQDVDGVQAQVFKRVKAQKYFFVGDVRQSIYIFRGACADVLDQFKDYADYSLNYNYRSYQSIIDFANEVYLRGTYPKEYGNVDCMLDITERECPNKIICSRGHGPEEEVFELVDERHAYNWVNGDYKDPKQLLRYFISKKPFILCRSNKQVKQFQALGYTNVSTVHQAKGLEYPNVIVTDFGLATQEEVNIAYVACTRAMNGLMIAEYDALARLLSEILYDEPDLLKTSDLF